MSVQVKMLWGRSGIELWKTWYGHYDRPAFVVIHPLGRDYFPSFDDPKNWHKAIKRVRELRAEYEV